MIQTFFTMVVMATGLAFALADTGAAGFPMGLGNMARAKGLTLSDAVEHFCEETGRAEPANGVDRAFNAALFTWLKNLPSHPGAARAAPLPEGARFDHRQLMAGARYNAWQSECYIAEDVERLAVSGLPVVTPGLLSQLRTLYRIEPELHEHGLSPRWPPDLPREQREAFQLSRTLRMGGKPFTPRDPLGKREIPGWGSVGSELRRLNP